MKEVIDYLKRNSNIKTLLNEFKKDFSDKYYELTLEQKEVMIDYADTFIRKWIFSPLAEGTYVTPIYIINTIAQNKIQGDYWIIPSIKIKKDINDEITFKTKFLYYSEEESPIIEDLQKVLKLLRPTIVTRDENKYLVEDGESFIEKISFKSDYYFQYLIDISNEIGILDTMKSIGCKCFIKGEKYDEFDELSNKEKIKLIIDKSMKLSREKISDIIEGNNKNSVQLFLNNGVTEDTFFASMQSSLEIALDFVKNISKYSDNEEEIANISVARSMLGDEIGYWLVKREAGVYLDMNITSIFGYYLGIINPIYEDIFLPNLFMDLLIYSDDPMEKISFIFSMEYAHDLTNIGENLVREFNFKIDKKRFKSLVPGHIKECIYEYKKKKDSMIEDIKKVDSSFLKDIITNNKSSI